MPPGLGASTPIWLGQLDRGLETLSQLRPGAPQLGEPDIAVEHEGVADAGEGAVDL